jgi:hemoglobin/transferrin/lactoferrin receptor protein
LEERYQYLDLGNGQRKLGNPNLEPETSVFCEGGLNWVGDDVLAGVSVFQNELHDLIGEKRVDAQTLVNANINRARIYGVEMEARWRTAYRIEWYGNAAGMVGKDTRTDEYLPNVAPLSGFAGVEYNRGAPGLWGYVETAVAARQDKVPEGVRKAAGWTTVDVRVGWNVRRAKTDQCIYVGAQNLFDKAYRNDLTTYRGTEFNEPGRSLVAGCEVKF